MKFNTYATTESVKTLSDRIDALTILTPHDFNVTINDIPSTGTLSRTVTATENIRMVCPNRIYPNNITANTNGSADVNITISGKTFAISVTADSNRTINCTVSGIYYT